MSRARASRWRNLVAGVLFCFFGLAGCATPTPYQPTTDGYGYADEQIESNRYLVTFAGNSLTPRTVVETYLLYRAAEITLASGHDWFVIASRDMDAATSYSGWVDPSPGGFFPYGGGYYGWGGGGGFGVGLGTVYANPSTRYTAQATIVVYSGEKPDDNVHAYDARDVLTRLKPKLQLPPPPTG